MTRRPTCRISNGSLTRAGCTFGSVVVADDVEFPGVPAYRSYMEDHEDTLWRTTEHRAHVEYQSLIRDVVLESEYLGHSA